MEKIVLLGATGSVGKSVLDVIRNYPNRFKLIGISGFKNYKRLEEIIKEFSPEVVAITDEKSELLKKFPNVIFETRKDGLNRLAEWDEADTVIIAISGMAGLHPTISAIRTRKRILSANKEAIVAAGEMLNRYLSENENSILPLDSEHNAIFNIYTRMKRNDIKNITLTASGGPFLNKDITEGITIDEVLSHPTWDMGSYITVNSATMMNKGFEVIEAHYLFHLDYSRIHVLTHPQSLVHGIVETRDGSSFMAVSPSDMRYPIALAMFYPEIPEQKFKALDLTKHKLEFYKPDIKKFPLLQLAYNTGKEGGILPSVLNAANEIVVQSFLNQNIKFYFISDIIHKVVDHFSGKNIKSPTIDEILESDSLARQKTQQIIYKEYSK